MRGGAEILAQGDDDRVEGADVKFLQRVLASAITAMVMSSAMARTRIISTTSSTVWPNAQPPCQALP
ncbi:MAG: hypothetical protein R2854_25645 [Caldilineaceae bacterium]